MSRLQLLLLLIGVILIVGLYQLPRVVVENESLEQAEALGEPQDLPENHALEMPADVQAKIDQLRRQLELAENQKNSIIFADSLGRLFLKYNEVDSAAKYAQTIFEIDSTETARTMAGLLMYGIFEVSNSGGRSMEFGALTRKYLEPVYEATGNPSLKIKIGMTYVGTNNPMKGILMIREVLEDDPNNTEALFNLGFLAIQSGQLEKAVERFEKVLSLEPENMNASLYLGITWMELGEVDKAKIQFEYIVNKSNSVVLEQIARGYLEEIK